MPEDIPFRTVIKFAFGLVVSLLVLAYVVFQARFLIIGPQIVLTEELDVTQNQRQVFLTGHAFNISHLWLNDRPIFTNAKGDFKEALVLENGYTIATLRAEDRYGRETKVSRSYIYTPACFIKWKNERSDYFEFTSFFSPSKLKKDVRAQTLKIISLPEKTRSNLQIISTFDNT